MTSVAHLHKMVGIFLRRINRSILVDAVCPVGLFQSMMKILELLLGGILGREDPQGLANREEVGLEKQIFTA